jgi:DNA-binding MarR family transcriptional regulator
MADTTRLGELLMAASRRFSQRGVAAFGEHGLSPARVRLLLMVGGTPGLKMVEAAESLGVSGRAVTPLVDALTSEGLLERRPDPADRRAFRLELTEAGRQALAKIEALQAQVSTGIFAALSVEEQEQLERLLAKFVGADGPCPSPQGGTQ